MEYFCNSYGSGELIVLLFGFNQKQSACLPRLVFLLALDAAADAPTAELFI